LLLSHSFDDTANKLLAELLLQFIQPAENLPVFPLSLDALEQELANYGNGEDYEYRDTHVHVIRSFRLCSNRDYNSYTSCRPTVSFIQILPFQHPITLTAGRVKWGRSSLCGLRSVVGNTLKQCVAQGIAVLQRFIGLVELSKTSAQPERTSVTCTASWTGHEPLTTL
jgi:hypothetical protein